MSEYPLTTVTITTHFPELWRFVNDLDHTSWSWDVATGMLKRTEGEPEMTTTETARVAIPGSPFGNPREITHENVTHFKVKKNGALKVKRGGELVAHYRKGRWLSVRLDPSNEGAKPETVSSAGGIVPGHS